MKSIILSLLAGFTIITSTSCKKFLDVQPKSSISDEVTIVDLSSAETALNGTYNALGSSGYYGISFPMIGYTSGDNVEYIGTLVYNKQFTNHEVRSDNQTISAAWTAIYKTINSANHLISKVPAITDPSLTTDNRNRILGEALFIRALAYFDVARIWGGAPLVLTPTLSVSERFGIAKSSVEELYAQVLSDLEDAEPLLPLTTNRFKATRKTAWALLSRFYLYQKNWEKAEFYADKLITDNNYELIAPYNSFFSGNVTGTKESVFEIQYSTAFLNNNRNDWQPATSGGGRRIIPTTSFINAINDPAIGGNRNTILGRTSTGLWYGNLYYRSPATDPSYIIRIAEVYLNRAEARAQQEKLTLAVADLDAVRHRANLAGSTAATKDEILLAIENERRFEFGLEPHRWFDLVRTGRAATVLNFTDTRRYVMPIPVDEIIIDNALEQNPGY